MDSSEAAGHHSPNFIAFTDLLFSLTKLCQETPMDRVHLYHDEQKQFEPLFRSTYETLSNTKSVEIQFDEENTTVFPLLPLEDFSFVDSKSNVGVQLADCLGYVLNRLLTRPGKDQESVALFEMARRLLLRDMNLVRFFGFEDFEVSVVGWLTAAPRR